MNEKLGAGKDQGKNLEVSGKVAGILEGETGNGVNELLNRYLEAFRDLFPKAFVDAQQIDKQITEDGLTEINESNLHPREIALAYAYALIFAKGDPMTQVHVVRGIQEAFEPQRKSPRTDV